MKYAEAITKTDISNKTIQFYLDGMSEEAGEVSGVLKRVRRGDYGKGAQKLIESKDGVRKVLEKYPKVKQDLFHEIGDEHWYGTRLITELGLTWRDIETMNTTKVKRRKREGTTMGEGSHR